VKEDFARVGCTVVYTQSKPGLPAQRNIGLDLAESEVTHFIDDDSLVDSEYFSEILKVFEDLGGNVAGVGGIQSNVVTVRPPLVRRFFLLSAGPGQVTKAACNSLVSSQTTNSTAAGWLSGCAMSYWKELAKHERFDESMKGYALGEDLEFSSRMARHGLLVIQPAAKIVHKRSEHNRLNLRRLTRDDVVNRWHFVQKHDPRFSRAAYAWSLVGMICIGLAKTSLGRFDDGVGELLGIRDGLLEVQRFSSVSSNDVAPRT
jgi:GT2 family glycosyltransferase